MHMEDILLVHRKSNSKKSSTEPVKLITGCAVWKTCLRQIAFFDESSFEFNCEQDDQILRGAEALKFLLEVLTGLHSPVLGETEVLGQFRLFIELRRSLGEVLFSEHRKWLNFLMTEVKRIRSELVCGLGSNSYGGIIRQQAKNLNEVSILGSGHLAKEILPWLTQKSELTLVCRDVQKVGLEDPKYAKVNVQTYQSVSTLGEALVIAAPLEDEQILALIQSAGSKVKKIFDLRGEQNQLKLLATNMGLDVLSLEDMFAELAGSRTENEHKVAHIKKVITQRVDQFMERSELRPMGWDDICA